VSINGWRANSTCPASRRSGSVRVTSSDRPVVMLSSGEVLWFPQANGPATGYRHETAKPQRSETASDLGPSRLERVTGIEPALSAWESDCHASLTTAPQVGRHLRLSVGTRQVPLLTLLWGMQRARREACSRLALACGLCRRGAWCSGSATTRRTMVDRELSRAVEA
jgi:hypothetical protein